jgi:hypothetical protein
MSWFSNHSQITESLGEKIEVSAEEGKGLCLLISNSFYKNQVPVQIAEEEDSKDGTMLMRGKSFLVVDDER